MINVTQSFLPPFDEFQKLLKKAWDAKWLTNRGGLVLELEDKINKLLDTRYAIAMNNGTIPIQIALKIFGNGGEIITTPFSYIATSSSIIWGGCKPIFVDIDPEFWTIDADKIESAITSKTTCILATHVFGNPCDVTRIEEIAKKYNLIVIYDAAHCFGVKYNGDSIFNYGEISTCSFHSTKIFHTGEGGMFFTKDDQIYKNAFEAHNFGHQSPTVFSRVGINGKMSELSAALGLAVLPYLNNIIEERKKIVDFYIREITNDVQKISIRPNTEWNYSYFPIVFKSEEILIQVVNKLNHVGIFPRRYFYPSLNTISFINGDECPISESISCRILCLPLFVGVSLDIQRQIVLIINEQL